MMMRTLILSLLVFAFPIASHAQETKRATAKTANIVLKVVHVLEVRQMILDEAKELGGFHTLLTETQVTLKVPPKRLSDAIKKIGAHGLVMEKNINRKDLTQELAQLQGLLRSKQDIFGRLEKLIDDSDLASTLNIERAMGQLVSEIEQTKGKLRVQREAARWAVIQLSFQFRQREDISYVQSPFVWLNSVDLPRFLGEF